MMMMAMDEDEDEDGLELKVIGATDLLLDLQLINLWGQIRQNLVGTLVELKLGGNELGQVLERVGSVEDVLHDAHGLLGLVDKVVFGLFNLGSLVVGEVGLFAVVGRLHAKGAGTGAGLDGIERQTGILNSLAGALGELEVGVEGGGPAGQEAGLDAHVLVQTGLTDPFLGHGVLFKSLGERVVGASATEVALLQQLGAGEGGAGNGMVKSLGLGLRGGRGGQSGLDVGGVGSAGEELDLLGDGAAKVIE